MNKRTGIFLAVAILIILVASVAIAAFMSNPNIFSINTGNNNNETLPTGGTEVIPEPSSTLTSTPTATPKPNSSPAFTPIITPAPTATPASTPTATPTPTPTATPTSRPTATPTPTPAVTPVPTPTPSPTPIPTPSPHPTVDPATILFSDDFATETLSTWTNTDISGVFLGVKNHMLECSTTTPTNGQWGYVYTWLNQSYDSLNWRWYLFFGDLPTTDGNIIGGGGMYNSEIEGNFTPANGVCAINVVRINGECHWNLAYVDGDQVVSVNSTQIVDAQTWYLVELKGVQGAGTGEVHCYVNDVEILSATNLTNNYNAGIDHVSVGGGISADKPVTWYCASAIASTEHIGPKPSVDTASFSSAGLTAGGLMCVCLIFGTMSGSAAVITKLGKKLP